MGSASEHKDAGVTATALPKGADGVFRSADDLRGLEWGIWSVLQVTQDIWARRKHGGSTSKSAGRKQKDTPSPPG